MSKLTCSLPDHLFEWIDFLWQTLVFVVFLGGFSGKNPTGRVVKQIDHVDRTTIEESGFHFEWYDSWICFLTLNKTFWILAENFEQGCQYCILRVKMNNFRKDILYWNKLKISICCRIFRKKNWTFSEKKLSELTKLHKPFPEAQFEENMFFWIDTILHI